MRVVWKDSNAKLNKPVKYRGYYVRGYEHGWETTIPGDNNIYKTHYNALNAIDKILGGEGRRGKATRKREEYGIEIIGCKDKTS